MGCNGSKPAEAPKSAHKAAKAILLQEPGADSKAPQSEEPKEHATATQGPAIETGTKEVVATAAVEKAQETANAIPADANSAKAETPGQTQEAQNSTPDATRTNTEELKTEQAATEKASAKVQTRQEGKNQKSAALNEIPSAAAGVAVEKVAEAETTGKAEVAEVVVLAAEPDAAAADKKSGCFSYCTVTEAQTEIVVQD